MKNLIIAIALLWPFGKYTLIGHNNSGETLSIHVNKHPECYMNQVFYMDTKNGKDYHYVEYPTEHYLVFDYYIDNKQKKNESPRVESNDEIIAVE